MIANEVKNTELPEEKSIDSKTALISIIYDYSALHHSIESSIIANRIIGKTF